MTMMDEVKKFPSHEGKKVKENPMAKTVEEQLLEQWRPVQTESAERVTWRHGGRLWAL